MAKGKYLMGNETPAPRESADKINGERRERVMTIKPTPPKPKKITPRPKPKPKPTVNNKQVPIPNKKRNLPGPVMPPPKGGDPIRRKGNLGDKVKAMPAKPKFGPRITKGGR